MPMPAGAAQTDPAPTLPTVLHIAHQAANLALLEESLQRVRPVRLLPAWLGRLGLDLAAHHRPALIVLHLELPDLPGQELLQRLKAQSATASIPVLTVGPPESASLAPALVRLGAHAHLTEPLEIRRLMALLGSILA